MKDFKAFKFLGSTDVEVEVCEFNGMMAICSDDEGPVLITKEQAMKFFNLSDVPTGLAYKLLIKQRDEAVAQIDAINNNTT